MAVVGTDINYAKSVLENDLLVAIPTETVYGLAGNALHEKTVAKIFETKNRPFFDPLIIHLHSIDRINEYVVEFPKKARQLADLFWPGPLTLLLPKKDCIPDIVTAGLPNVAVRIPNHPLTLALLETLAFPLAAPSANPFTYISPTAVEHVQQQLGEKIPYILDGGNCSIGLESTIVGFEGEEIIVYRLGGLAVEQIENCIGPVQIKTSNSNPTAPGMLSLHYAPKKQLLRGNIHDLIRTNQEKKAIGVISYKDKIENAAISKHIILSPDGNLNEAATKLFAAMRILDEDPTISCIFAEIFPEQGLGRAINDRLKRAEEK